MEMAKQKCKKNIFLKLHIHKSNANYLQNIIQCSHTKKVNAECSTRRNVCRITTHVQPAVGMHQITLKNQNPELIK